MKLTIDFAYATLEDLEDIAHVVRARIDRLENSRAPLEFLQGMASRDEEVAIPMPPPPAEEVAIPMPPPPPPAGYDLAVVPPGVDIHGDTWDAVVHSVRKSKNADGSWRRKRGAPPRVDPVASHEAENLQCIGERELVEYISNCVVKEKISAISTREVLKSHGLDGTILDIYKTTGDVRNSIYDTVKRLAEGVSDV